MNANKNIKSVSANENKQNLFHGYGILCAQLGMDTIITYKVLRIFDIYNIETSFYTHTTWNYRKSQAKRVTSFSNNFLFVEHSYAFFLSVSTVFFCIPSWTGTIFINMPSLISISNASNLSLFIMHCICIVFVVLSETMSVVSFMEMLFQNE